MSLRLQIVSPQRRVLGERGVKVFGQDGGTIGRSVEADWSLPDGYRYLSGRHASIDYRSGAYYIVDTSKNGVYINDADAPVGRGKPQRLFPGDRIRIGEYELSVAIENVDDTREALADTNHIDPVDLKQRVEAPEPAGRDLVDEHVITGVGIEMFLEDEDDPASTRPHSGEDGGGDGSGATSDSIEVIGLELELEPDPESAPAQTTEPGQTAEPRAAERRVNPTARAAGSRSAQRSASPLAPAADARSTQHPANPPAPAAGNALAAFCRGAGLKAPSLNAEQTEQLMTRLGQVTRELVVGVIDSLRIRSLQKAQLSQVNTTIEAHDNNSLKFSGSIEEALERLLLGTSAEHLSPIESVRSACADINQHQRAVLKAVRVALDDYLEHLEPEQLEQKFSKGRAGTIMGAASKLKYWDLYKDLYLMLSQHQTDELPQPFLEALGRAYEEETAAADARAQDREAG